MEPYLAGALTLFMTIAYPMKLVQIMIPPATLTTAPAQLPAETEAATAGKQRSAVRLTAATAPQAPAALTAATMMAQAISATIHMLQIMAAHGELLAEIM